MRRIVPSALTSKRALSVTTCSSLLSATRRNKSSNATGGSTSAGATALDGSPTQASTSSDPSAQLNNKEQLLFEPHHEAVKEGQGFFSIVREEFAKLFKYVAHDVSATAESSAKSVKSYADTMTDNNLSPEEKEKRRKKEEAYRTVLAQQAQRAAEADAAKMANMTWAEKLKYNLASLKQATSPKQGMASLVQHCAAAHAAEVAVEQGIDVKNIQVVLEQVKKQDGIGFETKVVGYIDAPKATEEEVYQFAEKLKRACPAAGMMEESMDWRRAGSDVPLGGDRFSQNVSTETNTKTFGGEDEQQSNSSLPQDDPVMPKHDWNSKASFPSAFSPSSRGQGSSFDNPFQRLKILKEEESQDKRPADNKDETNWK